LTSVNFRLPSAEGFPSRVLREPEWLGIHPGKALLIKIRPSRREQEHGMLYLRGESRLRIGQRTFPRHNLRQIKIKQPA